MRTHGGWLMLAGLMALVGCSKTPTAGPQGGDLVPIKDGTAYAELVSNADTGQVMVETWDRDLKGRRPIEQEPIMMGSNGKDVALMPYPTDSDPPGTSSRFHGQADWVRGGGAREGWMMHGSGTGPGRRSNGGMAGRPAAWRADTGRTWDDMAGHRGMWAPVARAGNAVGRWAISAT